MCWKFIWNSFTCRTYCAVPTPTPSVTTGPPSVTTGPPSVTTGPPSVTTGPPSVTTGPPSVTTGPPSVTTGPPSHTTGICFALHHHHHQSLNRKGRWGTTDDFATSFLHFSLFSTALWVLPNSRPVHSLMLSSHLFLCPPCLLLPFTVPYKMVLARPDERETWPYHCSLRLFTIVRRSSCGPIACWILARTSSLVTWSLYEMCSI